MLCVTNRTTDGITPAITSSPPQSCLRCLRNEPGIAEIFNTLYHATVMHHDDAVPITSDEAYCDKACGEGRIVRLRDFDVP